MGKRKKGKIEKERRVRLLTTTGNSRGKGKSQGGGGREEEGMDAPNVFNLYCADLTRETGGGGERGTPKGKERSKRLINTLFLRAFPRKRKREKKGGKQKARRDNFPERIHYVAHTGSPEKKRSKKKRGDPPHPDSERFRRDSAAKKKKGKGCAKRKKERRGTDGNFRTLFVFTFLSRNRSLQRERSWKETVLYFFLLACWPGG